MTTVHHLSRLLTLAAIAVVWGGLFYGSLALAKVDLGHWAALCGPWGCLPSTAPLLSVHAMWLTLIGGAAWLSRLAMPVLQSWTPWAGMLLASLIVAVGLLGFDLYRYASMGGATSDLGRRALYKLITWTDLPLVQIAVVCLAQIVVRKRAGRSAQLAPATLDSTIGSS